MALHSLAGALWTASATAPKIGSGHSGRHSVVTFVIAPSEDSTFPGLRRVDQTEERWTFPSGNERFALSIGKFTFDIAKIVDHAQVLFPFVTPGLSLEHFGLTPKHHIHKTVPDPFARGRGALKSQASNRPLVLTDAAMQSLIDASWARRDRWSVFQRIIALAETHSPDVGQLPELLQRYRDQNWLQPYVDASVRDPRLWAELSLAAAHVNFIGFIRQYASEHPSTKATTELLFLMDKVAQASRDALATLIDTDPDEQLAWTREANRNAYDLVVEIRHYYLKQLARRGLTSRDAISAYYDQVRLAI